MASEFYPEFFSKKYLSYGYKCKPNKLTGIPFTDRKSFTHYIKQILNDYIDNNDNVAFFLDHFNEIQSAYSLYADQESRIVYIHELGQYLLFDLFGSAIGNQAAGHMSEQVLTNRLAAAIKKYNLLDKLEGDEELSQQQASNWLDDLTAKFKAYYPDKEIKKSTVWVAQLAAYGYGLKQYLYEAPYLDTPIEIGPDADDVCLDLGSCFGETALWMLEERHVGHVYLFDITDHNIEISRRNMQKNGFINKCTFIKAAASDQNGSLYITLSSVASNNRISSSGTAVPAITIDEYCKAQRIVPNFIKMDIEGAELAALRGASQTIKQYKPKLALSAYHRREDLFVLPLYLKQLNPGYHFYLKKSHNLWETVLFAKDFSN